MKSAKIFVLLIALALLTVVVMYWYIEVYVPAQEQTAQIRELTR